MIGKVADKRAGLALQWNTKTEIMARLLIFAFSFLAMIMGYFVAAGCAMAYNHLKDVIGAMDHGAYKINYIIGGVCGLIVGIFFFVFIGIPAIKVRRAESVKPWIILATIFNSSYYVLTFSLLASFAIIYHNFNQYFLTAVIILPLCCLITFVMYFFFWREVKKQWKMRKGFEYLAEEKSFQANEAKLEELERRRQILYQAEVIKHQHDKHSLNEQANQKNHVLQQKHVWTEEEREEE
ncbi:hypothetical protein SSYRP_v1c03000 [Spiroplasma syrphidicola EA-1]|uniref:Transmembrane protein n=1 Tax=Spiroplasma syrphidicola EA-1 TaxID=1276229 RepID=R4UKV5_9MOLU|nr:hypothetical protein [Spiroplasma syrphidicola]AGM25896.1 hypothetical protein SSYRP_v1c03000 [Spiroplasma syrphidicola EA-1]